MVQRPMRWVIALGVTVAALAAALIIVILCFTITPQVFSAFIRFLGRVAPIGAAVVAALALALAAWSAYSGVRQRKRQVSLTAWAAWSDASRGARRMLSTTLGEGTITDAVAIALVEETELRSKDGTVLTRKQQKQILNSVAVVLNGLERLGVGVHGGIYDLKTIVRLGGTIVLREWDRLAPYITRVRETPTLTRRQKLAYVELEQLTREIRAKRIDEDRLRSLKG